ncbi:hypothetical protein Bca52824_004682 [Brassica carinata]|uniref:Uncharacterized protein n=1 Tax=Brassica carinata TaxID=52824 RepID=A0A8X8BFQ2_BRACI|nr:hypothetical protein Bca52824_004682 [Brassica carinata]
MLCETPFYSTNEVEGNIFASTFVALDSVQDLRWVILLKEPEERRRKVDKTYSKCPGDAMDNSEMRGRKNRGRGSRGARSPWTTTIFGV